METLTTTPEKNTRSSVIIEQDGKTDVYKVNSNGLLPDFEGRVQRENTDSPSVHVDPQRGIYGLRVPGDRFTTEGYRYGNHSASQNTARLEKNAAAKAPHSPVVTLGKDALSYYAPVDSPYSIVALTGRDNEAGAVKLTGKEKSGLGTYVPVGDERIYIVQPHIADFLVAEPTREHDVMDMLRAEDSSFAVLEISDAQVADMAHNTRRATEGVVRATKTHEEVKSSRAENEPVAVVAAEEPVVVDRVKVSEDTYVGPAPQPANEDKIPFYHPDELIGSQMPIIDAEIIEDDSASAKADAGPAPRAQSVNEPQVVTPMPSDSARALERLRADNKGTQDASVTPRFVETDRYTEARDAYAAADQELARRVASRTKLGMFARKKTREAGDQEVAAQEAAYERIAQTFDTIQMEKWISNGIVDTWRAKDPSLTDEQVNERIAQKLANYHTAKQRLHNLHTQDEFRQKKGKFGKLSEWNDRASEWYAGLGKKEKVAVGIGAAVVGGALGLVAAPLGVIGGAGLIGAKVYKTSMQTRSGLYRGLEEVATIKATDGSRVKTTDELRRESAARMEQTRADRVENADKVNRKARLMTLASVALVGAGFLSQTEVVRDAYQGVTEKIGDWWNADGHTGGVEAGNETGSNAGNSDHNGSTGDTNSSTVPPIEKTPAPAPAPNPEYQFSNAARTVVAGEGFYNTFTEMGITNPAEQANLLQKVGPELVARGWAYPMADGTYGISRQGALPQDVLELIQKSR